MDKRLAAAVLLAVPAICGAQPLPPDAAASAPRGVPEAKVQRIVVEDDQIRVDELRVRGQTRWIVVRPKLPGAPAYQIGTNTDGRDPSMDPRSDGRSLWQIFSF